MMRKMSTKFALFTLLLPCIGASICDIVECRNGGVCVEEEADFSGHHFIEDEPNEEDAPGRGSTHFHCQCTQDWTGRLCDIPYNICAHSHICYNGGTCISDSEYQLCDCTTAMQDGFKYEGKYCEFKVSTVEEHASAEYENCPCKNGGVCDDRVDNNKKCVCPEGYDGFFCEFDDTVPRCDLACKNGGYCVFAASEDRSGEHQKCHCLQGFTGLWCEVEGEPCGDAVCLNGSSCVSQKVLGGIDTHHCDCRTAESRGGKRFAGRYCQYEETTSCNTEDNIESRRFCVNGGVCKMTVRPGCECPEEFTGLSCEFYIGANVKEEEMDSIKPEVDDVPECTLDCNGHGVCTYGIKDNSALGDATYADGLSQTHDNLQHCICEEGYTGIYCDREISLCHEEDMFCLNGGTCHIDASGSAFCDCDTAGEEGEQYYGPSCEFLITSVCSADESIENLNARSAFCVNDGTCTTVVGRNEQHPGCLCADGWTGYHCEKRTYNVDQQTSVCTLDGDESDNSSHTCQNGGICKSVVVRGNEHPGCDCQEGWKGLLCDTPSTTQPDFSIREKKKIALLFPITLILLCLTLLITVALKLIPNHSKPKKEAHMQLYLKIGAPRDTDGKDEINLAPKHSAEEVEQIVFLPSNGNPNSDLISQFLSKRHPDMLLPTDEAHDYYKYDDGHDSDPTMYFGPTLDEDGFPLQDIELL